MKYIYLVITETQCEEEKAQVLVFDHCKNLEKIEELIYATNISEEDIVGMIDPNITEYKMYFDHIGGGGMKRTNK